MTAYVLLEDGERFDGDAVGAGGHVTGEVVFTTGMSGYQESMTDPSFARQIITFTTAHVGNYGVSAGAWESDRIHAAGTIMREAVNTTDAPGAEQGWLDWLATHGVPGIPLSASQSSQPLLPTAARMIAARAWMRSDSIAASLTP